MPDTGFLTLSLLATVMGAVLFLFPDGVHKLSGLLNRTIAAVDEPLLRYRYLIGVLSFVASYALFRLALWVPHLLD